MGAGMPVRSRSFATGSVLPLQAGQLDAEHAPDPASDAIAELDTFKNELSDRDEHANGEQMMPGCPSQPFRQNAMSMESSSVRQFARHACLAGELPGTQSWYSCVMI